MMIQINQSKDDKLNIIMEKKIIFALCTIIFIPSLNNFVNCILQIGFKLNISLITPISYVFMALCSVFILYKYILQKKSLLIFSLFLFFGCIISYFLYYELKEFLYSSPLDLVYSPLNILFYFCIPAMIGGASVKNFKLFFKYIKIWSRITIILGIFTYLFVVLYKGEQLQYMVYSYKMLIPICACFIKCDSGKKIDLFLAILGSVCIFLCGARGAVLSLFLFLVMLCVSNFKNNITIIKLIIGVLLIVLITYNIINFEKNIIFLADLLKKNNIDSRFLYSLIDGTLLVDNARSDINNAIIEAVKYNPLGYGFYGDRYATIKFGLSSYYYAHNIVYEIICQFGLILGCIIIISIIFRIISTLYKNRGTSISKIILVLLPVGMFQLFFSSSYLQCSEFFVLIGMLFFGNYNILENSIDRG